MSDYAEANKLALDVSLEKARALHRVWRALNDGDCPKCHRMHAATEILRDDRTMKFNPQAARLQRETCGIGCPSCGFKVLYKEIELIEMMFAPAMDAAVAIFEEWRSGDVEVPE